MQICINPDSVAIIDLDECLGTSLATINTNFRLLKESECLNSEEISNLQIILEDLISRTLALSAQSLGIPKAVVTFDATTNYPIPLILSKSTNVENVSSESLGTFIITFDPPLKDDNYAIIGTTNTPGYWVQPSTSVNSVSAEINIQKSDGTKTNPSYVSISIFNI